MNKYLKAINSVRVKGNGSTLDYENSVVLAQALYLEDDLEIASILDECALNYINTQLFTQAVPHLRKAVCIVKKVYGPESVELAQEQFKFCTVLFNSLNTDLQYETEMMFELDSTIKLFETLKNSDTEFDLVELIEMRRCILFSKDT